MSDQFIFGVLLGGVGVGVVAWFLARVRLASARDEGAKERRRADRHMREAQVANQQMEVADTLLARIPTPLYLVDSELRVLRNNKAAIDLLGKDLTGSMIDYGFRQPVFLDTLKRAIDSKEGQQTELTLPVPIERSLMVQIEPLMREMLDPRAPQEEQGMGAMTREDPNPTLLVMMLDLTPIIRGEQLRADFVANVSHELRTPLSSLIGFIETLRGPARDDPDAQERFLAIMQEQADRMYRLIADLLSLSRIEMYEHSAPSERVDLEGVIIGVCDMLAFKAKSRSMRIDIDCPDNLPDVSGDEDQLTQVFQNLIDNALKYGHEGTDVSITMRAERNMVTVSVMDRGGGIAREHLARLTERFYRVDAARSRALGGTGLGLAIVKHIINRHRGKLSIDSEPGKGSIFTVSLKKHNQA